MYKATTLLYNNTCTPEQKLQLLSKVSIISIQVYNENCKIDKL